MSFNEKQYSEFIFIMFQIMVYVGPKMVAHSQYPMFMLKDKMRVNIDLKFRMIYNDDDFQYAFLPFESRIGINVWAVNINKEAVCLGSVGSTIFNYDGKLKTGTQKLLLWPCKPFPKDIS